MSDVDANDVSFRQSSAALAAGRYYGYVRDRVTARTATVSQVVHDAPRALPRHDHACAYFCMLVDGHYQETVGSREFDYSPFDVSFHPARVAHRDRVGPCGGRFLCVEVDTETLDAVDVRLVGDTRFLPSEISVRLLRLYRHLLCGTLSAAAVDSVVWELCGGVAAGRAQRERSRPAWMRRCLEIVEEDDGNEFSVGGLAARVGVHPVHLAREFRARFGQTLGEYVQKVRVRRACARIASGDAPLVRVAADAGFADQSHFCRVFKRHVGCTPSAYVAGVRVRVH
jgi:AraC family transcriptional regulator